MQFTIVFLAMPFNLNPLFKLLYSLLPYREATLHLPFSKEVVRQRLAVKVPTGLIVHKPIIWGRRILYYYQIELDGYCLRATIAGGDWRGLLVATGQIQDISGGSVLPLKMRLPTLSLVFLLSLGLGWLAFFVTEKPPREILPFFLITLLLSYALFVYLFRYHAERTLNILKSTILLQNSAE
ncbi:hypothetical protein QUB56_07940 [Microcoleus sp. AR_TQ3_B6]|uniref:hypothetical protein n=1 Tax=Microcoleus sp. AR_TQ3_B6 TaxID=3055284 RepID=UPI002FD4E166